MFNDVTLITTAIVIIIILTILSYDLYFKFNYKNGVYLDIKNTFKNIFNLLPEFDFKININNIDDSKKKIPTKKYKNIFTDRKKEVFNIDYNDFTYEQAKDVCKSLNSELATYNQLIEAHKKGANWCNYGWSANQMALFPIQADYLKNLKTTNNKLADSCGKPGVNGGYFDNKNLKFGINCYGYKKNPDPARILYLSKKENNKNNKIDDEKIKKKKQNLYKNLIIRPFNDSKWSKYSFKKSSYIINPNYLDKSINYPKSKEIVLNNEPHHPNSIIQEEE